jgi:hypothetical protein
LKNAENLLFEKELEDKENENSCMIAYYQVGPEGMDLKTKLTHSVVMQYLDEPFFN